MYAIRFMQQLNTIHLKIVFNHCINAIAYTHVTSSGHHVYELKMLKYFNYCINIIEYTHVTSSGHHVYDLKMLNYFNRV